MSYSCLLVDDEPFALELLTHHISRMEDLRIVAACRNTQDAFDVLSRQKVDLMFLDIRMPGKDGIRFLSELADPPQVILTTAYRDYAMDGFDLGVVDYLLKPISFVRFGKAVEKFLLLRSTSAGAATAPVIIRSGYDQFRIIPDDILLLESKREYIRISFRNGPPLMVRATIPQMLGYLPEGRFIQVHRSYIVPVGRITAVTPRSVLLGGQEVPLGRTYKQMVSYALSQSGPGA